jgi:hypothetical protein
MIALPPSTSAEAFHQYIPGRLLATGSGPSWKDVLVRVYTMQRIEGGTIMPAVAEPLIVWFLSGSAVIERLRQPKTPLTPLTYQPHQTATRLSTALLIVSRRKDFLPVEPQSGLSFLFLLGAPRFA